MRCMMWCGLGLVIGLGTAVVRGDEKDNPLAAYEKAGQPGPQHKALQPLVGEWTYTGQVWFMPGAEPLEISGLASRKSILGGRFIQEKVENLKPMANFTGMGLTGYDNATKKYTAAWVDSMSTSIITSTGTVDKSGKVFTFVGEHRDPVTGKKVKSRDVLRIVDQNRQQMESYREENGKEIKVMEFTYVRKK
jgi:Protein of unknown function (DUF1579)